MPVPTHDKDCKTLILSNYNCSCGMQVYFFVCTCSSKVLFEDLSPNWTKHKCIHNIIKNAISNFRSQGYNNDDIYNQIINLRSVSDLTITTEVENILQQMLSQFSIDFEIDTAPTESNLTNIGDVQDIHADMLESIKELEKKMIKATPAVMKYITEKIERGRIGDELKKLKNYKCLICEKLRCDTQTFLTPQGLPYIEVHHVIPISTRGIGVNSLSNLITVCAKHHRQLHYGAVKTEILYDRFHFHFEDRIIEIKKININQ